MIFWTAKAAVTAMGAANKTGVGFMDAFHALRTIGLTEAAVEVVEKCRTILKGLVKDGDHIALGINGGNDRPSSNNTERWCPTSEKERVVMTDFVRKGRLFRVTAFNPSHRQLFLGSEATPVEGITTRVEVYIGHVELMLLKPFYSDGLHIRQATAAEFAVLSERHGIPAEDAEYTWMLERDGGSFVVGANPSWREAERASMGDRESLYSGEPWPEGFPMESGHVI